MTRELRPHQERAIEMLRDAIRSGSRRPMIQAPTGFGKTRLAAELVNGARSKGRRAAFVVPALGLIDQTIEAFVSDGADLREIGVIQSDHPMQDWSKPIQICSIATVGRRAIPECDLAIFDEAHIQFKAAKDWLSHEDWRSKIIIGLSATPWSKGLGKFYDRLLVAATTKDLIRDGYLSDFKVFASGKPDLSGVKIVAGDYHEGQLSAAMQKKQLVADVVGTWLEKGPGNKTLVFAVDLPHARAIKEQFDQAGIDAGFVSAKTERDERVRIGRKFNAGQIPVVVNVGTLTTGIDWDVRCISLARPTQSEILFTQIIGRGLRTAEGKEYCTILDHSDTHTRLGFVTDIHYDEMDMGKEKKPKKKPEAKVRECPKCTAIKEPARDTCWNCGHKFKPLVRDVEVIAGRLEEMKDGRKGSGTKSGGPKNHTALGGEWVPNREIYGMLRWICEERAYKSAWAAIQYRDLVGVWPNAYSDAPAAHPSGALIAWLDRQRRKKYAMSKKMAA